ncbi:MAG: hypothetical protein PUB18_03480 [bacterium]|nr:hypothetical protein [bacterium]
MDRNIKSEDYKSGVIAGDRNRAIIVAVATIQKNLDLGFIQEITGLTKHEVDLIKHTLTVTDQKVASMVTDAFKTPTVSATSVTTLDVDKEKK